MAAIPFYLVTGYLGSGKTTLLKRFLERHADRRRIAVVQNEFASAGIDGNDLRQTGKPFELLEVDRGSVFCVCLMADFVSSLEALLDQAQPDAVVLEASGLADPIAIAQLLTDPRLASRLYLAHSWCVVDASTFPKLEPVMARVAHQVRVADTVVLNKTDLATTEALDQTRSRCPQLNPLAQMAETSYCSLDLDEAFGPLAHPPVALQRADEHAGLESSGRPAMGSAALRVNRPISGAALDDFLSRYRDRADRLKGFVRLEGNQTVSVQLASGHLRLEPVSDYTSPTELIALGPGIDTGQFARDFRAAEAQHAA